MSVTVVIPPLLLHLVNDNRIIEVNGSTVGDCLHDLIKRFPGTKKLLLDEKGKLRDYLDVFINGESSYPEELSRAVHRGDRLHIVNILAGG